MSTSHRLFSGPLSMFGAKAQIAVLEKGLRFRARDGAVQDVV